MKVDYFVNIKDLIGGVLFALAMIAAGIYTLYLWIKYTIEERKKKNNGRNYNRK